MKTHVAKGITVLEPTIANVALRVVIRGLDVSVAVVVIHKVHVMEDTVCITEGGHYEFQVLSLDNGMDVVWVQVCWLLLLSRPLIYRFFWTESGVWDLSRRLSGLSIAGLTGEWRKAPFFVTPFYPFIKDDTRMHSVHPSRGLLECSYLREQKWRNTAYR